MGSTREGSFLDDKYLPRTNTLAYSASWPVTKRKKSFITLTSVCSIRNSLPRQRDPTLEGKNFRTIYKVWWNKLLGINQVYYCRFKCKMHKHYNYLQSIFNLKLFINILKCQEAKLWFVRFNDLMRMKWAERKGSKVTF